jgi:Zn-dependent protease
VPELTPEALQGALLVVVAMVLSSAVHEWAHAFTAVRLGDETPRRQGRLTLNPIVHIDPIGTLLMPAFGALVGFLVGYARPVEFMPTNFTRRFTMRTSIAIVALAGPLSNLVLAFACAGALRGLVEVAGPAPGDVAQAFMALLRVGVILNVVLCLFNFLPVYPLDGSKILEAVLPRRLSGVADFLRDNQLFVMMLVFLVGARFLVGPVLALSGLIMRSVGL